MTFAARCGEAGLPSKYKGDRTRTAGLVEVVPPVVVYTIRGQDSDIPKLAAGVKWTRPGALVPAENKQQVTLRLDSEVLDFFKNTGARYQSRINAVLREYMKAQRDRA